eukprot:3909824-Rhodomonas_salina.5
MHAHTLCSQCTNQESLNAVFSALPDTSESCRDPDCSDGGCGRHAPAPHRALPREHGGCAQHRLRPPPFPGPPPPLCSSCILASLLLHPCAPPPTLVLPHSHPPPSPSTLNPPTSALSILHAQQSHLQRHVFVIAALRLDAPTPTLYAWDDLCALARSLGLPTPPGLGPAPACARCIPVCVELTGRVRCAVSVSVFLSVPVSMPVSVTVSLSPLAAPGERGAGGVAGGLGAAATARPFPPRRPRCPL